MASLLVKGGCYPIAETTYTKHSYTPSVFLPLSVDLSFHTFIPFKANFKESYMAAFYDYFNEQKYADAVKNVSVWLLFFLRTMNLWQTKIKGEWNVFLNKSGGIWKEL